MEFGLLGENRENPADKRERFSYQTVLVVALIFREKSTVLSETR